MSNSTALAPLQLDLLEAEPISAVRSFRSERKLLNNPFFGLANRPHMKPAHKSWSENGVNYYIRRSPGEFGGATQSDFEYLLFMVTAIMKAKNDGKPLSNRIRFSVHDCLRSLNRGVAGKDYQGFSRAMKRLMTTTVFTNLESAGAATEEGFNWLQNYRIGKRKLANGREVMDYAEVVLCDWVFNAVLCGDVLSIDRDYLALTSGLEKKLWLLFRTHLGRQSSWPIGLDKLLVKTGYEGPRRKFLFDMKDLVARQPFKDWFVVLSHDGSTMPSRLIDPQTIDGRKPVTVWVVLRNLSLTAGHTIPALRR